MRNGSLLCTSESVSEGHPDKIADQISDRILDAFLARDPDARVACETLLATPLIDVAGGFLTCDDAISLDVLSRTPQGAINAHDLRRPIHSPIAAHGYSGRD